MDNIQSVITTNVDAITTGFHAVTIAYCECHRKGAQAYQALLTASHAYLQLRTFPRTMPPIPCHS